MRESLKEGCQQKEGRMDGMNAVNGMGKIWRKEENREYGVAANLCKRIGKQGEGGGEKRLIAPEETAEGEESAATAKE